MINLFENIDAVYIAHPSNLFYFSGYENADARMVLTPTKKYYLTDKRALEEARELVSDCEFIDVERGEYVESSVSLLADLGIKTLGYEDETITHAEYLQIEKSKIKLHKIQDKIHSLRAVKSLKEIELIKSAQSITEKVFDEMLSFITPGQTEKEVSAKLNSLIFAYGGTLAFDTIVAFGKNTSKPHAHPSDNKLKKNDFITLDFGAKLGGYCSDMTRSLGVGQIDNKYADIYYAVLEAQEGALKNLKAGITGAEGDAFARDHLKKLNLDKYFVHSLGHSLGIDIHERPNLSPRETSIIPQNSVLSVEPGLYIEGEMGVRIEDIVVFEENNIENLTKSPKQLIIL